MVFIVIYRTESDLFLFFLQSFMMCAIGQSGDIDSYQPPCLTIGVQGSMVVHH